MIARAVAAVKSAPENMWEAFKALEVNIGHFYSDIENRIVSDIGNKIISKIEEVNPDLNVTQRGILFLQVRAIARKDAGLKDEFNFTEKEDRS
jgi:hypothetical protein